MPDFSLELEHPACRVIGTDEVGRGPLAGPVIAAAVYIPPDSYNLPLWKSVTDSKKLSPVKREKLFVDIQSHCLYGIGEASVDDIDRLNILQATFLAMRRAIDSVAENNSFILIDGNRLPKDWMWEKQAVVKGDSKSVSIAAASILAKVTRDKMMERLAEAYPHYGWVHNAGYGTAEHLAGIDAHGITPHHRKSFAPIKNLLQTP